MPQMTWLSNVDKVSVLFLNLDEEITVSSVSEIFVVFVELQMDLSC